MSVHICGFLKPLGFNIFSSLEHGGGARDLVIEFLAITVFPEGLIFFSRLSFSQSSFWDSPFLLIFFLLVVECKEMSFSGRRCVLLKQVTMGSCGRLGECRA